MALHSCEAAHWAIIGGTPSGSVSRRRRGSRARRPTAGSGRRARRPPATPGATLPSRSLPRYSPAAAGHASSTSASVAAATHASRRLTRASSRRAPGEVSRIAEQVLVHELDLQLGDAVVDVAHQAAALAVAAHPLDERAVVGVEAEQLERAARLRGGLLAEDQPRADQVLDLADVGELLGGEDQRRVLGAPEPVEPVDQAAPVARGEQEPRLVEQHHLVHASGRRRRAASRRRRSASASRRRAARTGRSPRARCPARAGSARAP